MDVVYLLKYLEKQLKKEFCKMLKYCVTEDLLNNPDDYEELNGFSIAPKKNLI